MNISCLEFAKKKTKAYTEQELIDNFCPSLFEMKNHAKKIMISDVLHCDISCELCWNSPAIIIVRKREKQ